MFGTRSRRSQWYQNRQPRKWFHCCVISFGITLSTPWSSQPHQPESLNQPQQQQRRSRVVAAVDAVVVAVRCWARLRLYDKQKSLLNDTRIHRHTRNKHHSVGNWILFKLSRTYKVLIYSKLELNVWVLDFLYCNPSLEPKMYSLFFKQIDIPIRQNSRCSHNCPKTLKFVTYKKPKNALKWWIHFVSF